MKTYIADSLEEYIEILKGITGGNKKYGSEVSRAQIID